jgi:RNA polymerase sigma-70 factor (ECF subfamily)
MMDDNAAIEKCRNGETDAFRFLVGHYQSQAISHAAAILGDLEDAKDAVQEAFVDAYRSLPRFDTARRFYPWLYVLVRNRCFKAIERRRPADSIEEIEILAAPPGLSQEEGIALGKALSKLSAEEREIVTLKYLDGLSYNEIAEYLEIPGGTVMSRLFYARRHLHELLAGVKKEVER